MHLSVVVPSYNEEKNLVENIIKFNDYLAGQSYDYEIIIVNDGSTDKTKEVAEKLISQIKNLRFLNNKINRGKGAAVCQGLMAAKGKYRLFTDADNSTSINHIEKAWPYFHKGYDVVIGSRNKKDAPGARQVRPQSLWKRYWGVGGNYIIRLLVIRDIRDTQCGFKILTQSAVENIVPKMTANGFAFDVEILALAKLLNYKIAKIPVCWINSPVSRVKIKYYFLTLKEIMRIKWSLRKRKRYYQIKIF
jgi:dolichyl-phosphate beta-glucosyltransferase